MGKKLKQTIGTMMLLIIPIFILASFVSMFVENWKVGVIIIGCAVFSAFFIIGWINIAFKLLDV